ncbi:MAG TPA: RimK family protein [Burkholderiaceae bacterium]|nr:RimK family protein [Burkholderiaceae bacterium]
MTVLFVVNRLEDWPFEIPGSTVVTARAYLTDPRHANGGDLRVINLCRADRYQGRGYYVSLLAEARGHRPLPDVKTIEDLQSQAHLRTLAAEIDSLAQNSLRHAGSDLFELDAYFGRDASLRHPHLAQQLYALLRMPLIRAHFERSDGRWRLKELRAVAAGDTPPQHRPLLLAAATEHVTGRSARRMPGAAADAPLVAILADPNETDRPSNDEALRRFVQVAPRVGLRAELVGPDALERLEQYSALFIRMTTGVAHLTYEFARRAAALALPVIDDPDSILKCTNKVYLNELLTRHGIPRPQTLTVHRENLGEVVPTLGLPCVLKQPDSGFGLGVVRIDSEAQLMSRAASLLEKSELLIAQEWLPTDFDWRVCVLDRRPLFVCKYFMAPGHWQVIKRDSAQRLEGQTLALSVGEAPDMVTATAVRAANLIGSGLYGVDLKQIGDQVYLIEINDNPNIDAGNEDQVLGDALYREVMGVLARRIRARRPIPP